MSLICWECRHVVFTPADPGYSEYTPGSDFALSCGLGHWQFDSYDDTLADFRRKLQTAATCPNFARHPEEARDAR